MHRPVTTLALALLVLALPVSSQAATIVYQFSGEILGYYPRPVATLQYTAGNYITGTTSLTVGDLDSCSISAPFGCDSGMPGFHFGFYPDATALPYVPRPTDDFDILAFAFHDTSAPGNSAVAYFYFANGAFSSLGTFATDPAIGNPGELTIREVGDAGVVPEPASLLLLGTGLATIVRRSWRGRRG